MKVLLDIPLIASFGNHNTIYNRLFIDDIDLYLKFHLGKRDTFNNN